MNTSFRGDNILQAGLPSRMSEERQYRGEERRLQSRMSEKEDENGLKTNLVDGLYTPEDIEEIW